MPDVLVTGLPRSGLTLAGALIDSLPNAVCLNSPQAQGAQARKLHETIPFCKWLAGDFVWHRSRLATQDAVNDYRAADGSHLLDSLKDPDMLRDEAGQPKLSSFTRAGLKGDFILAMKHDTLYTCVLPTLLEMDHFKVIAIIRHPLDVISSWESLPDYPIGQGKVPFARHYWQEAALMGIDSPPDLMDRFVQIYELFLGRYHEYREQVSIIKYEDMIDNPVNICLPLGMRMTPPAAGRIVFENRVHSAEKLEDLRARFRKYGVFTRYYYPDMK